MKNLLTQSIAFASIVALPLITSACFESSPATLQDSTTQSESASGPTVHTKSADRSERELLKVHSVYLAKPIIGRNATGDAGDIDKIESTIRQSWLAESTISIAPTKVATHSKAECEGARLNNADACLVITLTDYQERQGSSVDATVNARVSFTAELIRVSDKTVIFERSFSCSNSIFRYH